MAIAPLLREPWVTVLNAEALADDAVHYANLAGCIGRDPGQSFPFSGYIIHVSITGAVATNVNAGIYPCRDRSTANRTTLANATRSLVCTGLATFIDQWIWTWDLLTDYFQIGFQRASATNGKTVTCMIRPFRVEQT